MARLCEPDSIVWIDGSEEEKERLTQEAVQTGEMTLLNQEKLPGCLYHRTAVNDVARTEDLTFICSTLREDAGPTNNWMSPEEGYRRAGEIFKGSMRGRTMYVIPFSMGPVGSPFSKIGVELTDSIYVVLNMRIMTHVGAAVLKQLGSGGEFTKLPARQGRPGHQAPLDPATSPRTTRSGAVGSGYGGNVLLGKKCLALRIASYLGKQRRLAGRAHADHGRRRPRRPHRVRRRRLPQRLRQDQPGHARSARRAEGQGLSHLDRGRRHRLDADRHRRAAVGHQSRERASSAWRRERTTKSNPNMMKTIARNTIYTNVVLTKDGNVWWEGGEGEPPAEGIDWQGRPWKPGMKDADGKPVLGAHPNSRFTAPVEPVPFGLAPHASITTACRFRRSFSAAAGRRWRRWSTRPSTGSMACSSGPRWPRSGPPPRSASWARSAATRWPCCPSAATTWAITSSTG